MKHFSFISGLLFIGFISVNSSAQIMGDDNCIDYEEMSNISSYDQDSESSDESVTDVSDTPDGIDYPEDYFDEGGGIRTLGANDRSYYGTDEDDTIYFGYCSACGDNNNRAILICGWDDVLQDYVVLDKLDFACSPNCGILEIDGQDGNNYIEFISNRELNSACEFDDSSVIYSEFTEVDILGHTGNDTIIGNSEVDYITRRQTMKPINYKILLIILLIFALCKTEDSSSDAGIDAQDTADVSCFRPG